MKLAQHEISSSLWQKIVDHYTPLLAKYRNRLENPSLPEQDRIELCWKIKNIKDLFELAEPERKQQDAG